MRSSGPASTTLRSRRRRRKISSRALHRQVSPPASDRPRGGEQVAAAAIVGDALEAARNRLDRAVELLLRVRRILERDVAPLRAVAGEHHLAIKDAIALRT